jgi:3-phosphoshikimate 1-carboxyvinyltransferase
MGAEVDGQGDRCLPPLRVRGGSLTGITWTSPVASAQVKSAILLAGLDADGTTVVVEPVATRTHTEDLLADAGADLTVSSTAAGRQVRLQRSRLHPLDLDVPGDPSQAAFWVVGACVVPGSDVVVEHVYDGPERLGFVRVLQRMGADVELRADGTGVTDLRARFGPLTATIVDAAEIPSLDEVPILAVAAACATGTTVFHDMGELRVKESDRLAAVIGLVRAIGAGAEAVGDDLWIHGAERLTPARTDSGGDHRMAMAAVIAALAAGEPGAEVARHDDPLVEDSVVAGFGAVETSYPTFVDHLVALGGSAGLPGPLSNRVIAIDGPAGAGKSTVSTAVAAHLGLERLDTGAMYRAVAWGALERQLDLAGDAVADLARDAELLPGPPVLMDGVDVTKVIRSPEVSRAVSTVAANPAVRRHLVERQRRWVRERGGGVVEGRDIGTVVFPEARLKVFLTASPEERSRRRADESVEGVARRDRLDSTRATSPLVMADDARLLDTTGRSIDEVVDQVLSWL